MESQEKEPVKKVSKHNNHEPRKRIIAVATVFAVACAFSYLAGAQQQTPRFSPMVATAGSNQYSQSNAQNAALGSLNENMGAQNQASTNIQPAQGNIDAGTSNNLAQNDAQANFTGQGSTGNGFDRHGSFENESSFGQEGVGGGFGGHEGGRGRHGRGSEGSGGSNGTIAQSGRFGGFQNYSQGSTGTYSANVQRCCATGKTGTCHS